MGPMTGYEIRQRIEMSIGNFWSESFGQIYPALNKLRHQGLVEAAETGKKGRRVYSLTASGRKKLKAWLALMPQPRKPRDELLLKVFFGGQSEVEIVRAQVLETRARSVADLERYIALEPQLKERQCKNPGLPYYLMALNYGLIEARAIVAWTDETLASLDLIASSLPKE
jgi:PadR family transcriptional regulator, regulatory protein AphA